MTGNIKTECAERYAELERRVEAYEAAVKSGEDTSQFRELGQQLDAFAKNIEHRPSMFPYVPKTMELAARIISINRGNR